MIHDELRLTLSSRFSDLPSIFFYAWVIPYTILFLGVVIYFLKFVLALPKKPGIYFSWPDLYMFLVRLV